MRAQERAPFNPSLAVPPSLRSQVGCASPCACTGLSLSLPVTAETLLGLATIDSYGMTVAQTVLPWMVLGGVATFVYVLAPLILARHDPRSMVYVVMLGASMGFASAALHWGAWATPAPKWRAYVGVLAVLPISSVWMQLAVQSDTRTLAWTTHVARVVGPLIAAWWYSRWVAAVGTVGGLNGAVAFSLLWMGLSAVFVMLHRQLRRQWVTPHRPWPETMV